MSRFDTDCDDKTQTIRQPIVLTESEAKSLRQYAKDESRSNQGMAGIIYRMGLEAYERRNAPR